MTATATKTATAAERYAEAIETVGREYAPILRVYRDEGRNRPECVGTNDRATWATNGYSLWWTGDTDALPDKLRIVIPTEIYAHLIEFKCTPELTRTLAALVKSERWDVNRHATAVIDFDIADSVQLAYIFRHSWSNDTLQPPVDTALPGTFPHRLRLDATFLIDALKFLATGRKGKPFTVRLTCGAKPRLGAKNSVLAPISIEGFEGTAQLNRHVVLMPIRFD